MKIRSTTVSKTKSQRTARSLVKLAGSDGRAADMLGVTKSVVTYWRSGARRMHESTYRLACILIESPKTTTVDACLEGVRDG